MQKEIGGYFELENYRGSEYYPKAIALNSGRSAIAYIVKAKKYKKVYVPFFSCDAIHDGIKKGGAKIEFYHINKNFDIVFNKKLEDNEALFLINYYGLLENKKILNIRKRFSNLIVDNTQAFFQKPLKNIDTIYSCRKFFGVSDGAYLCTNLVNMSLEMETDISTERMVFVLGRYDSCASEYYQLSVENNKYFSNEPIMKMSKITKNFMRSFDYDFICKMRTQNFKFLNKKLASINILKLKNVKGAFMYPLLIESGVKLRIKLQKENIYIPCLWPNVLDKEPQDSLEFIFSSNILPIPCDQRYNLNDMNRIVNTIFKLMEKKHNITEA